MHAGATPYFVRPCPQFVQDEQLGRILEITVLVIFEFWAPECQYRGIAAHNLIICVTVHDYISGP